MDAHKLYMLSNTYGQQAVTHFLNDLVYSYRLALVFQMWCAHSSIQVVVRAAHVMPHSLTSENNLIRAPLLKRILALML
jgi:hypothetical protein